MLVTQTRYQDLPLLLPHTPHTPSEKIPRLEEVFQRFPHATINVDCKHQSDELVNKVNQLIEKYHRPETTIWGSFSDPTCQALYRCNPHVPLIFSAKQIVYLLLKYYSGVLPFCSLKESVLEIPLLTPRLQAQFLSRFASRASPLRQSIYRVLIKSVGYLLTRKRLFAHLQQRGIKVVFWVVNSEEDVREAMALGADGIMTDVPTEMRKYLECLAK
eukprot:TRINITY_DN3997_c0_g1_i11.p1 TRINITY_DN3997_c0_g1~~TRINITY_DN3997_c0_g1_i11.p1  ORF type:complete len:216 (+),score=15.49 TRINITY_DN3997_c0_g1_i11:133-780(+)